MHEGSHSLALAVDVPKQISVEIYVVQLVWQCSEFIIVSVFILSFFKTTSEYKVLRQLPAHLY